MRRATPTAWVIALVLLAALVVASPAAAHPLGNFSQNHQTRVSVSATELQLHYILDQAEIPTFQQRGERPAQVLAGVRAQVARAVTARADGRALPLRLTPGGQITFPQGQGGLHTTRVELDLTAPLRGPAGSIAVHDATFPGRVGWKAVIVAPGAGTAVRSSVPQGDPTNGLRAYPASLLSSPQNTTAGTFQVRAGDGTVQAPDARGLGARTTKERSGDAFTRVFDDAAAGRGAFVLLLLLAFGWGALHAISPGHGKAMVAAYLVGTRGTSRDAVVLGLTVTVTHTIGVFALGVVTLALSAYILPADLYPWLNLASGLLVVGVGAMVLRSRLRARRAPAAHAHHDHDHGAAHDHGHSHGPGGGHHHHHHPAADGEGVSRRGLLAMGVSAGLIPCPSALVVLLAAIAQHQIGLGLVLIVAFSAGLAATLTGLGILVVHAGRVTSRVDTSGRVFRALPALSAVLILCVGLGLTLRALPTL
jgi:nickel/cobalt transporter (NicO) family protein